MSSLVRYILALHRSSCPELFRKKGVLKNFTKFPRKHCHRCQTLAQVFSCEFCEIFKNTYFYRTPLVTASALKKYTKLWESFTKTLENLY